MIVLLVSMLIIGGLVYSLTRPTRDDSLSSSRQAAERLGWRDNSQPQDQEWPVRYSGVTSGISWTISNRPDRKDSSYAWSEPEAIWWTTDAVKARAFILAVGYTPNGTLDWNGSTFGVQRYEDIEIAMDETMEAMGKAADAAIRTGATDFVEQLQTLEDRTRLERPWLTFDRFLATARDVTLADPPLRQVQIKVNDSTLVPRVFNDRVKAALTACLDVVSDSRASLRIWIGAPDLRIHIETPIEDDDKRVPVFERVVELGAALAESSRAVATS